MVTSGIMFVLLSLEKTKMAKRTTLLFIVFYLVTIGVYSQEHALAVAQIDDSLIENANVVTRFDHTIVDQTNANKIIITKHKAITALNKRGSRLLVFRASYKEGSTKIKDIELKYYDKDGKVLREVSKKDIEDIAAYDGFSMITDYRIKYFEYESTSFPISVEWKYTLESKNTLLIPPWVPIEAFGQSVELSTYRNGGDVNDHYEQNLDGPNITKKTGYYSCEDIPAYTSEPLSPSIYDIVPYVLFSPRTFVYEGYDGQFTNWQELGKWRYDNFIQDRNNLKASDVRQELDEIINGETDPEAIARMIYDYVQETTRYINISLDEGGVRPMKSQDVHTKKYGDCKALSFYMKSLLDIYNVNSNYVEVYADGDFKKSYIPEFCSATQGNHIILNIPLGQDTAWVDCTSNELPFNFLGDFTDDRLAMMVTENGGKIVKTPNYSAQYNNVTAETKLAIDQNGETELESTIKSTGIPMKERLFLQKISDDDWEDRLKEHLFSHLNNLEIKTKEKELIESDFEMIEKYSLRTTDYGSIAGQYMILPLTFKKFSIPRLGKTKQRKYKIHIKRGYSNSSIQTIKIPEAYQYIDKPLKENIISDFGEYSMILKVENDSLVIKRSLIINEGIYSPERYVDIRSFFNAVLKNENLKYSIKNQK